MAIHKIENENKYGIDFFDTCTRLAVDLAAFKNPAFSEEMEIRLLHLLNFETSNGFFKLVDNGGFYFGEMVDGQEVKFRMADNLPVPYIDINFTNKSTINPIKEVYVGPKNNSNLTAIAVFLETVGLGNVTVKKSVASYL